MYAKDLQPGDRLEPDGTTVVRATFDGRHVEVVLRIGGRGRPTTYQLDPYWPLRRAVDAP